MTMGKSHHFFLCIKKIKRSFKIEALDFKLFIVFINISLIEFKFIFKFLILFSHFHFCFIQQKITHR